MKSSVKAKLTLVSITLVILAVLALPVAISILSVQPAHAAARTAKGNPVRNAHPFCSRLGKTIQASSGTQMWCFGPQPKTKKANIHASTFGSNVDAANPAEDVTPSGVQAYGQSEVSVAATGPYVVEAWNDITGFFSRCLSPQNKEELTGFGFSADGGASFVDEGGLPNNNCSADVYFGDPSVEAWQSALG